MKTKIFVRTVGKGKKGVRIAREKYEVMRKAILAELRQKKELPFTSLLRSLERKLAEKF